ncbi:DUF502 domain-containing protein [Natronolimnobius sp. AArcel1]|uniref:DUF502 domain-containing protein n=1 Tax=Natronolimnobius sp. AArcel1 TaxID=1679093 RepID=UPI0013ED13CE|nr:DUF502 domain-containing protein [Natronolimnobius sp. AArcel1]NGM68554.1 DUF502 domain-containing protein [Natronolimnobius sp. AArcel1]
MAGVRSQLKQWLINGVAITIPLVVTLLVLIVVVDVVLGVLSPLIEGIIYLWPTDPPRVVVQSVTLASLVAFFLVVGAVAEYTPGRYLSQRVHRAMETIPGIRTVYESVRRAANMLVDDDTTQFQEVKLVEFPHENAYMLGFLTADTPPRIEATVSNGSLETIMVPLGPNPTTNGFVMHVPRENIHDIDITVEEAIRSIATLGVATDDLTDSSEDPSETTINDNKQ